MFDLALPLLGLAWLAVIVVLIGEDQIALQPPRPPTRVEALAARPKALVIWARVYPRLLRRLPPQQPLPPDLGAVWATRTGRICGLVESWDTGLGLMTPFYTVDQQPRFRLDDERQFLKVWSTCRFDIWAQIHVGAFDAGYCATRSGRKTCHRKIRRS